MFVNSANIFIVQFSHCRLDNQIVSDSKRHSTRTLPSPLANIINSPAGAGLSLCLTCRLRRSVVDVGRVQERHFGGRSQESNLPDRWRPQLDLKSSRLTGDDDLPRLDCYMEAGRIIATSLSFYIPRSVFSA